jgi:hypothetical protein
LLSVTVLRARGRSLLSTEVVSERVLTPLFKEGGELLNCPAPTGLVDEITAGEFAVNLGSLFGFASWL